MASSRTRIVSVLALAGLAALVLARAAHADPMADAVAVAEGAGVEVSGAVAPRAEPG